MACGRSEGTQVGSGPPAPMMVQQQQKHDTVQSPLPIVGLVRMWVAKSIGSCLIGEVVLTFLFYGHVTLTCEIQPPVKWPKSLT